MLSDLASPAARSIDPLLAVSALGGLGGGLSFAGTTGALGELSVERLPVKASNLERVLVGVASGLRPDGLRANGLLEGAVPDEDRSNLRGLVALSFGAPSCDLLPTPIKPRMECLRLIGCKHEKDPSNKNNSSNGNKRKSLTCRNRNSAKCTNDRNMLEGGDKKACLVHFN